MNRTMTPRRHWPGGIAEERETARDLTPAPERTRHRADGLAGARADGHAAARGRVTRLVELLHSRRARPLRFMLVGGVCGGVQLGLLALFLRGGVEAILANSVAFLLSAQLNFALSTLFIWHDRHGDDGPARGLLRRWLAFHSSIAGTMALNQAMFLVARAALPDLVASALGIGAGALVNFLLQDRLVFRRRHAPAPPSARPAFTVVNAASWDGTWTDERVTLRRSQLQTAPQATSHATARR